MDAFSYFSVLLSIIIGLTIVQVLQGYRSLLLARGKRHLDVAAIWVMEFIRQAQAASSK